MMAVFAKPLLKRIASDLAERPLEPGELRHIPKMGPYHVSADAAHAGAKPLFVIDVEEKTYYIYYVVA